MKARRSRGHSMDGLPLDVLGDFLVSNFIRPRSEVEPDRKKCNLCGKCQIICRRHAIYTNQKRKIWTFYPRRCNLCLECVSRCPNDALTVVKK